MLSRGHDGALVGILNWSRTLAGRACLVEGPKWQKHQPGVAVLQFKSVLGFIPVKELLQEGHPK